MVIVAGEDLHLRHAMRDNHVEHHPRVGLVARRERGALLDDAVRESCTGPLPGLRLLPQQPWKIRFGGQKMRATMRSPANRLNATNANVRSQRSTRMRRGVRVSITPTGTARARASLDAALAMLGDLLLGRLGAACQLSRRLQLQGNARRRPARRDRLVEVPEQRDAGARGRRLVAARSDDRLEEARDGRAREDGPGTPRSPSAASHRRRRRERPPPAFASGSRDGLAMRSAERSTIQRSRMRFTKPRSGKSTRGMLARVGGRLRGLTLRRAIDKHAALATRPAAPGQ